MMSKSTHPSGGLKFEGTVFDGLGPEERQELEIEKKEFFHGKGEVIIQEGSSSSGVYCLVEGICKVSKLGVDGREQILRHYPTK